MDNSSFCYWNSLPNEIKVIIVKELGNNCRLALRKCSRNDKEIVDSVKIRKLQKITLWSPNDFSWFIAIERTAYSEEINFEFHSFDSFQQKLIEEIANYDFVEEMEVYLQSSSTRVKLSSSNLLKVGKLTIYDERVTNILEQVDPFCLRYLNLYKSGTPQEVFDMPQVINARSLFASDNFIRNDQLLKLKSRVLHMRKCESLTLEGINAYIKKCVDNLDNEQVYFELVHHTPTLDFEKLLEGLDSQKSVVKINNLGEAFIQPYFGNFQLKVRSLNGVIEGRTILAENSRRIEPEQKQIFKSVESVDIALAGMKQTLTIRNKNTILENYEFHSSEKLQEELYLKISGINYIKELTIKNTYHNWKICPPNKQITVGKLEVANSNNVADYLRQIEPIHLKEILIDQMTNDQQIYDMPQIREAEKLEIFRCRMNDEQLIKLNATFILLDSNGHRNITHSGINSFLKKCILNLKKYDYNITLSNYIDDNNTVDIFEGIDIFKSEENTEEKTFVLNSLYAEYQMEVTIDGHGNMKAKRVKRKIGNY